MVMGFRDNLDSTNNVVDICTYREQKENTEETKMKKLMLVLCLATTLLTGCEGLPTKEEPVEEVIEDPVPETISESTITMEAGVNMTVSEGDMIAADYTEMKAVVYCDGDYENYYTINVMLTNEVNMLKVYEKMAGTKSKKSSGWKFLTYDDQTIAGKKINDNQYCIIQTYMPQEVLESNLPEVV